MAANCEQLRAKLDSSHSDPICYELLSLIEQKQAGNNNLSVNRFIHSLNEKRDLNSRFGLVDFSIENVKGEYKPIKYKYLSKTKEIVQDKSFNGYECSLEFRDAVFEKLECS